MWTSTKITRQPAGVYGLGLCALLLIALVISGQQLLWLPLCALLASLILAWYWPAWVARSLCVQAHCLSELRQGQTAQWQVHLSARLPLWGLHLRGPLDMHHNQFIPGRSAELTLCAEPQLTGIIDDHWQCRLQYPFNLWPRTLELSVCNLTLLPGLEPIEYLPLPIPEIGPAPKALLCYDSSDGFALGTDVNQSQAVQIKLLANLSRALVARGYDVYLATSLGLLTLPAYSGAFNALDMALVQAQQAPMPAADLLARYNQRPDAQLIIAPQWLSTASVPEVFPGQQLWQLLFDEERFQHPLSRSRHSHRRLGAYHWQWVIEPQQPLARLFYAQR